MNTIQSSHPGHDSARLPLVVGVTGHRDLRTDDGPTLEHTVRKAFQRIRKECPDTPIILLSSLAEGADRLVAHMALHLECGLVAVLPMPESVYEEDFATEESRAEFRGLLQQATFALDVSQGRVSISPGADEATRIKGYALVGAFIAQSSQVLIALWDGAESDKEGGTAQVVTFAREGVPGRLTALLQVTRGTDTPIDTLDEPKWRGVVYHIPTPRISNPWLPSGSPDDFQTLYPKSTRELSVVQERYARIFARMNQLNRDSQRLAPPRPVDAQARTPDLLPKVPARSLPPSQVSIDDAYHLADALALVHQRRTRLAQLGLSGLVFLSAVFLSLYSNVVPLQKPWTALIYLAWLGVACVFWYTFAGRGEDRKHIPLTERLLAAIFPGLERRDYQNKHLDYRALAEGLRVQFYWRLAGLEDRVEDHYLTKYRTELDWIRAVLRNWDLLEHGLADPEGSQPPSTAPAQLSDVLTHWVQGQRDYFIRRANEEDAKLVRWEGAVRALLLLGVAIVLFSIFVLPHLGPWGGMLLVAAALAPVTAALIHNDAEKQALAQHIKQYERMSAIFTTAANEIDQCLRAGDFDGARHRLRALGKEALIENADWLLLHRERLFEMPRA